MADSKISALAAITSIVGTEELVVAKAGVSNKITAADLLAACIPQVSKVSLTTGDLTTSSTTFVDATGLTTTITTGAHRCLVLFTAAGHNSGANNNVAVDLAIDGTRQGQAYGLTLMSAGGAGDNGSLGFTYLTSALSAASHTFKIQWRVDATTGTLFASTGVSPAILTVIELPI